MEEIEVTMLKKGHISPEDLLKGMSKDAKQTWDDLEKKLSKAMSKLGQALPNADAGDLVPHLSDLLEKSLQKLADTGDPNAVLGAGELLKQAAKNAPPNVKEAADLVSEAYDKVVSHDIAPRILRSLDPSQLSAEEWNKLLNELENLDLKSAGRGPGGGIADVFLTKVFMDPRTRYRIRSYLKDLRTAPHTREVFSGYGKYIDARRTFRATTRTGMPMLVFRKPEYRPRTREDVVFMYDVSGSMMSYYALVASIAKALSELGLHVRLWYAEEGAVKATGDPLAVLKNFGGGGTNLDAAVKTVLEHEQLRDSTFIVYTDLLEGGDWAGFIDGLKQAINRGAYVSVFITDCSEVKDKLRDLQNAGIFYVCDVRSLRSMVDAIRHIKYYIKRSAVVR